jgi:PAS domain S-box-containing protein
LHDVTREREIQQRLTERLNFIESLLEASVDRILAMDRYMNYLYCNQNAAAYYGLRKEDIVGKNVLEIFPASVNDPTHDHFRRALKGETVHIPAIEGLSEEHYYEVFLIPIFSDAGTVSAVLWIHHDLSSEIKMQRQLRKSHEVLNAIESVFIELDSDYGYRYVNDTAERYLGKRRDELIGKVMWEVFPQTVGTPGYEAVVKASQERVKVEVEYFSPIFNKWVFLSVVPTSDGVILFFYDRQDIKEAQQKLVEEHRRMADAQALGKIGSFEWNVVDGDIVWSDELYRLNGLEPQSERITIERANAFIHPEHYGDLKKLQEQLIAKPGLYQITYRIVLRDGTVKWVNHQLESIAGENGAVVRVYGTVQDITAQRHIAEQLKEQSHYLQRITETVPDMVSVMELPSKKIQYLNKDVFVANGFDPDAMTHQSAEELAALIHPDDLQALSGYYEGLSKASDTDILTAAYRARNNAGAWQWFHVRGKVFQRDGTGQVTQILNAIENITDRKKAEAELFKNLNLLQQAEAVTSIGSWEYCIAEDKIEWSEGMYRLFDLEPGSKVTKEIYLEYVVKDDRPLVREMLKRMKKGVEPVDETITITSKTGMRKVLKVKGIAVKDAAGKPERMLGVDVDITEMVRAEENLVSLNRSLDRRNKELKVKNEELANFSFIASHDLREPLRKIHTFSDWLLERESENLSAAGQDYLKRMSGAVKRMDRLIDDVLALTKMHAATFETGTVDLNDVLKQAKAELAESIKATKARIEADNLPAITGSQVQLRYLFQNLISNAITFQKPGNQPQLTIMSERATAAEVVEAGLDIEQTYAKVCVSDNGIGIDEMYHPKIFQIFQRLHARTEYDGTGIGLTICKRVMENHNGTITIESTLGKGATFCCYFPVA